MRRMTEHPSKSDAKYSSFIASRVEFGHALSPLGALHACRLPRLLRPAVLRPTMHRSLMLKPIVLRLIMFLSIILELIMLQPLLLRPIMLRPIVLRPIMLRPIMPQLTILRSIMLPPTRVRFGNRRCQAFGPRLVQRKCLHVAGHAEESHLC